MFSRIPCQEDLYIIYSRLGLIPSRKNFCKNNTADILGLLYADKYDVDAAKIVDEKLTSDEVSVETIYDELGLEKEYADGVDYGWVCRANLADPQIMACTITKDSSDEYAAGFMDGRDAWFSLSIDFPEAIW